MAAQGGGWTLGRWLALVPVDSKRSEAVTSGFLLLQDGRWPGRRWRGRGVVQKAIYEVGTGVASGSQRFCCCYMVGVVGLDRAGVVVQKGYLLSWHWLLEAMSTQEEVDRQAPYTRRGLSGGQPLSKNSYIFITITCRCTTRHVGVTSLALALILVPTTWHIQCRSKPVAVPRHQVCGGGTGSRVESIMASLALLLMNTWLPA